MFDNKQTDIDEIFNKIEFEFDFDLSLMKQRRVRVRSIK